VDLTSNSSQLLISVFTVSSLLDTGLSANPYLPEKLLSKQCVRHLGNKFPTKHISQSFHILKINTMMPFIYGMPILVTS